MRAWNGENLAGKSIFVRAEQGLGDEILYATMLNDLRRLAKAVWWECDTRLIPLFRRSFPGVWFIGRGDSIPPLDFGVKAGDLGAHLRPSLAAFPSRRQILEADSADAYRMWRDMPAKPVGVSWSSTNPKVGARKTVPLDQWAPIFGLDRHFVALQPDGSPNVWAVPIDTRNDIDALAAAIAACAAVVTVSNTVAHLAGALGVHTHVMVPSSVGRFWYWGHEGERTPWYPSVTIHRQIGADWGPAVRGVAHRLARQVRQPFAGQQATNATTSRA